MPALSEAQLAELTRRNHTRVLNVRSQVEARVGALWDRLVPIDDVAAEQFATQAAALVSAGQSGTSMATAGYLQAATGAPGPSSPLSGAVLRNGVSPLEVYMRPVITARTALSNGAAFVEAFKTGRDRATSTAETDVMLAQRAQIDAWVHAGRITGYRRVLTGASCVLCATASTQRYHQGDLMPIHSRCDCGIAPIMGSQDPGRVINRPLYDKLKQDGTIDELGRMRALPKAQEALDNANQRIEDLRAELRAGIPDQERETRVEKRLDRWRETAKQREARVAELAQQRKDHAAVHQHGELGPVLTRPGDKFSGPGDF